MPVRKKIQPLAIGTPGRIVAIDPVAGQLDCAFFRRIVKLDSNAVVVARIGISQPVAIRLPAKIEKPGSLRNVELMRIVRIHFVDPKLLIGVGESE